MRQDDIPIPISFIGRAVAVPQEEKIGRLLPSGMMLEPVGEDTFDEICQHFADMAADLDEEGVELFLVDEMLNIAEARAAVLACRKFKKPVWVTVSIDEEGLLLSGCESLAGMITLQSLGADAFGFYGEPEAIVAALRGVSEYARIPLIAKPSVGTIAEMTPQEYARLAERFLDAGASVVRDGSTPAQEKAVREMLKSYIFEPLAPLSSEQENDIWLTNETTLFALDVDRMEFTEEIECAFDMTDDFLEAEDDSYDVMLISVETIEEAEDLARNAVYSALPVCIHSDDPEALSRVLFLYNGRAMVDSTSMIEEDRLRKIADRYGAYVY